jgi:tetratricopeptide (TPR) repeat protein
MYTQILKEILLTIKFEKEHITEFIAYCREQFAGKEDELKNINKFELEYGPKTPVWWYTYECFLYPMLNRALRTMDINIIVRMGFYISDLHRHIEKLHLQQFGRSRSGKTFTVHRGQGLSKTDYEQMMKNKGGLVAFNNFLSTSKDRKVSLNYARETLSNPDTVGILIVMTMNPSQTTTPFACIDDVSDFPEENEVLCSMHSVFRIQNIKPLRENQRLFQMDLTLTSDNDKDLRLLTNRMRKDMKGSTGWFGLGELLRKMGQVDKAESVHLACLDQNICDREKADIYHELGGIKDHRAEYKEAIVFYEKALDIYRQILPPNHLSLAVSYNNIGMVYRKLRDYSKSLSYYLKDLEISEEALSPNHPDLGTSYNNIGVVYKNMGDYPKALSYYEKALEIRQKSLPPNHPDVGGSYNNIGSLYGQMGDYHKARPYFEKSLEIKQQSLPPNHPDLGASHNNIGLLWKKMGNYSEARLSYERAVEIAQYSLPSNHPDLQEYRRNLESVQNKS